MVLWPLCRPGQGDQTGCGSHGSKSSRQGAGGVPPQWGTVSGFRHSFRLQAETLPTNPHPQEPWNVVYPSFLSFTMCKC